MDNWQVQAVSKIRAWIMILGVTERPMYNLKDPHSHTLQRRTMWPGWTHDLSVAVACKVDQLLEAIKLIKSNWIQAIPMSCSKRDGFNEARSSATQVQVDVVWCPQQSLLFYNCAKASTIGIPRGINLLIQFQIRVSRIRWRLLSQCLHCLDKNSGKTKHSSN